MSTPAQLGTITIGQAPRPDITPILLQHLPPGVSCVHAGLLDGLTPVSYTHLTLPTKA